MIGVASNLLKFRMQKWWARWGRTDFDLLHFHRRQKSPNQQMSASLAESMPLSIRCQWVNDCVVLRSIANVVRLVIITLSQSFGICLLPDKHLLQDPFIMQLVKATVEETQFKGHEQCIKITNGDAQVCLSCNNTTDYATWLRRCKEVNTL